MGSTMRSCPSRATVALVITCLFVDFALGTPPIVKHPKVKEWAKKSTAFHKKVFAVIAKHGEFGVGQDQPLNFEKDISGETGKLVKTLGQAGARLPNSYPLPLCAHSTEAVCVKHRGCAWDPWRHCYCTITFTPSMQSSSSSAGAPTGKNGK